MPVILPTRKAIILMGLGIPLSLIIAWLVPGIWVFCFAGITAILLLVALDGLAARSSQAFKIDLDAPPTFFVGKNNALTLQIGDERRDYLPETHVRFEFNEPVEVLPSQKLPSSGRLELDLNMLRRGEARLEALWLRWSGPFGFAVKQLRLPSDITRPINPDIRTIRADAIRFITREADFGVKSQRDKGDGSEFDAMREFVPGMDRRSVDWKASARHMELMAKEFRTERNHNIVLAYDTGRLMCERLGGLSRLDHAVHAGMLLAYASLRGGDRVGVYGFDTQPRVMTGLVRGNAAFGKLQSEMARLDYSSLDANYTLGLTRLSSGLNRRSLIILFTDFLDTTQAELMVENAARLSKRHLVLFAVFQDHDLERVMSRRPDTPEDVTRAVIADNLLQERRTVMKRLKRLGIDVLEAPVESFSSELLTRYLSILRQERI
ncbi:MAG: DUF58 domain-containing protein [Ponticaulis sp.]|nr:DUF58 domain-containing protein [Ponticaulis sp.]|tara:strand:- start:12199 stop:13506 length:1308 start_codon:yes stop_codon:yes gene_type:complete